MPYNAADVRARETLARILICGLPKAGKTTCAVLTAPQPVFVFNSDGKGALDPVMLLGGDFSAEDITDYGSYTRAHMWLKTNMSKFFDPAKGIRGTVVFDNISTFSGQVQEELKKDYKDGRQLFPELGARMTRVIRDLIALPLHLVVLGHLKNGEKLTGESTKFLSVPGSGGIAISALVQDFIGLEVSLDPNTNEVKREFLLAPDGAWQAAAIRSVKTKIKRMPADVSLFLELVRAGRVQATDEAAHEEAAGEAEAGEEAGEAEAAEGEAAAETEEAVTETEEATAVAETEEAQPEAAASAVVRKPAPKTPVRAVRAPVRSNTRPAAQRPAANGRSR